jgi:hypothetical protein
MSKGTRKAAKSVLAESVQYVGRDVVVISEDYLGTSVSLNSSKDIERAITLTNEGLKKLKSWQRQRAKQEKAHG